MEEAPSRMNARASRYRPRRWVIAAASEAADNLGSRLKTSPIIAQVLLNRGISQPDDCFEFLQPRLKCLHDPALLPNCKKAAARAVAAINAKEKIVVYGDYDVDGITAASILWHAIKILGGDVDYYIPHRIDEGYGLNATALTDLIDRGAKLIITVDCGITAADPARIARERGIDLIITDHHEWHERHASNVSDAAPSMPIFPDCYTIVHPRMSSDDDGAPGSYPNHALCGAGVAFKLAWQIGITAAGGSPRVSDAFREYLLEATALAALGTIADVVPLVGENRVLAAYGLGGLKASKLVGIQALIESANLTGQTLDSYHVGFLLAPRLNACGRMGHAAEAVEMLTKADRPRAVEVANYLEAQNRKRQSIEKEMLESALAQIDEQNLAGDDCRAIVLAADDWHAGVIGIVASRIVDRFCKPTILIAYNDNNGAGKIGQGSGRSIAGFHLSRALETCGDLLDAYGGHEMAAGLKIKPENFDAFRERFRDYAREHLAPEQLVPELKLDAETQLRQLTAALVGDLHRLGPFGHGNRKPIFYSRKLELTAPPRRVGKTGDHLQLFLRQNNIHMKAIAFGFASDELLSRLRPGIFIDLAFEPTLNEYNGSRTVELQVKDLQFHGDTAP